MKEVIVGVFLIASFLILTSGVSAQSDLEATVCCEITNTGAFCQNAPSSECGTGINPETGEPYRQAPTSCESTSFCQAGTCFDSSEGTCLDNVPQSVCNQNGGVWSEESPPQCSLGCCVLGDQAAFVTQVRCKALSSSLGLETNYNPSVTSELACIQSVQNQDRGACVFDSDFERTCRLTTRAECNAGLTLAEGEEAIAVQGQFFKDTLCSSEELATNCGPTRDTTIVPGKDEVYFVDSCGNPANIYDASRIEDKTYWSVVFDKTESCNVGESNSGSETCGNCNYLLGSFARDKDVVGEEPRFGDFICADLNCVDENGNERRHGESWCGNDDETTGDGANTVGSRFFRRICQNSEVVTEACQDFRAETCIEDTIETPQGDFSQAACRVNRWQDCLAQIDQDSCENTDRRDCSWRKGVTLGNQSIGGTCLPNNAPGLNFWNSEETRTICSQGNTACVVTFEKGLFGGEKCVDNCECLTKEWQEKHANLCSALGDCGPGTNFIGAEGFDKGFEKRIKDLDRFK